MKACLRGIGRSLRKRLPSAEPMEVEIINDTRALVDWLLDDNFVLMGISHYGKGEGPPTSNQDRELGYVEYREEEVHRLAERIKGISPGKLPGPRAGPNVSRFTRAKKSP